MIETSNPGRQSPAETPARARFIAEICSALDKGDGYAAGKLGNTERSMFLYPRVLERSGPLQIQAFEVAFSSWALRQGGIFPPTPAFLQPFAKRYCETIADLDSLGVSPGHQERDGPLLRSHGFRGRTIPYKEQEPDRSSPSNDGNCYLPLFRGRRLLIVSPFAELLRERATRTTFEAVWGNTGKPWFEPATAEAVEFPYGYSPSTWRRYPDAIALLDTILDRIDEVEYDIALIGAGTLGSLIAAALKRRRKVAISLGGHLQIVFGVLGERWRTRERWGRDYYNDAWIDMPDRYKPGDGESDENYW